MAVKRRYWLLKSEPETYSIHDLAKEKGQRTHWDGVRNYQARNILRDEMKKGDGVLFYHSNARPPAIVGTAIVVKEGYPDFTAFDPEALGTSRDRLGDRIRYAASAIEALESADALVICTEWNEFRRPDFDEMEEVMTGKVIFDGRNIYKPAELRSLGFHYESIGRPSSPVLDPAEETLRGDA